MNKPILNREAKLPDDGWYEIETPGEHFNAAAGVVQLLDAEAFASIANRFAAAASRPNFAGLLIDRDHFSLDAEKTSEAFGWLMEVRNRDGRLEGRVEWSDEGERAVKGRRFKFFSTVYDPRHAVPVGTRKLRNRDVPLVRPLELDRLALTNDPNNKGGKPISNRDANSGAAADQPKPTMKAVLKLLGLADDASEESAVAAITQIKNRATTAEGQVTTLTKQNGELLAAQVESDLEKYKNRFTPATREKWKAALVANRASTLELLEGLTPIADGKGGGDKGRITNRDSAQSPAGDGSGDETVAQKQAAASRAARIVNRAHQIAKEQKISFSQAYTKAEAEEPPVSTAK